MGRATIRLGRGMPWCWRCLPPEWGLTALLALAATSASPATAQAVGQLTYGQLLDSEIPMSTVTGRNLGVRDRIQPDLKPQGVTLGSFLAYPTLLTGLGMTTNVVGAERDARADGYGELNPGLDVQSQWSRNALHSTLFYDGLRFFGTPAKNQDGFLAEADGRVDILDQDSLFASASFRRSYEDQTEASFPLSGGGSVAIDQPSVTLRGVAAFNRARVTLSTDYNSLSYRDTVSVNGTPLDLSYRDRSVYRGTVRTEYLLGRDNSVFVQATYRRTDYRTTLVTQDRTSNDWRVLVGAIADVTQLVRVAGAIGYFNRTYPNPFFRPIRGLAVDMRVNYYLTPLTTLSAIVRREPEEAAVNGSSGYLQTRIGARADHELLRNLIPYVFADYSPSKFKGIDRHDRVLDGGGGVDYLLSRRFTLNATATYVSRDSAGLERGPNINEFRSLLSIRYHP